MSIKRLDGKVVPIKYAPQPFNHLTPDEKRIYNYLRTLGMGQTEKHIHGIFMDMATIGNKMRSMRKKGWVIDQSQKHGPQKWYAIP